MPVKIPGLVAVTSRYSFLLPFKFDTIPVIQNYRLICAEKELFCDFFKLEKYYSCPASSGYGGLAPGRSNPGRRADPTGPGLRRAHPGCGRGFLLSLVRCWWEY